MPELKLPGCRHDILGHYLKAIGLLRVLAKCAPPEYRDPDAEGWWNPADAAFYLSSEKYGSREKLVEFFSKHYEPTPVFSAWNTGGGLDEKMELVIQCNPGIWENFWSSNKELLVEYGYPRPEDGRIPDFTENGINIELTLKPSTVFTDTPKELSIGEIQEKKKGRKTLYTLPIFWSENAKTTIRKYLDDNKDTILKVITKDGKWPKPTGGARQSSIQTKFETSAAAYIFDIKTESNIPQSSDIVCVSTRIKGTGKKAVMAHVAKKLAANVIAKSALQLGRKFYERFQDENTNTKTLLEEFREQSPDVSSESFDSIFTPRVPFRSSENPLFMFSGKGKGKDNTEIFRTFWNFYNEGLSTDSVKAALFGEKCKSLSKGLGTPFFPDAIKSYNLGSGWVVNKYQISPLDYILAVEGAYAMRGSVARILGANTQRFAAFPFVFDAGEDYVDNEGNIQGTSTALWFPLWDRPVTFAELSSFIADGQSRLSTKDARFSSEFLRAINSQGVDAGFMGWQEFRFRMKGSPVPWITTGKFIASGYNKVATLLNRALEPLDTSRFIDQFEIIWGKGGAVSTHSPHPIRATINAAMENAAAAPNAENCLEILCEVFSASKKIAISKSFRKNAQLQNPRFFERFPMKEWCELLKDLENSPEFEIARAIVSIVGLQKQRNDEFSGVQPLLGSLLPLKLGPTGWYLPSDKNRSNQAVWSGTDLCRDLVSILQRRYMDSMKDDYPALKAVYPARLENIIDFLNGQLNDLQIARWIEALSLIGWHFEQQEPKAASVDSADDPAENKEDCLSAAVPLPYAALRTLLDLECAWQGDNYKRRRSQQPITRLCQCSNDSLAQATTDALRWIGIWGVPNPWGKESRIEREVLSGAYIVRLNSAVLDLSGQIIPPERIAAAVCIPLSWRDRWRLHQMVTLPIFD